MSAFFAFWKKEWLEHLRTGRIWLLGILFVLFGIMNPAIAKLTPVLLELLADSLAQSGMTVTAPPVSALDSWMQFFKNAPLALIVFLLAESSLFTRELQSGTLIPLLTKGLPRRQVVLVKLLVPSVLWTAGYWLCAAITWGYSAYYWDNSVVQNLLTSLFGWWMLGLFCLMLTLLFSVLLQSSTGALGLAGLALLLTYLAGLLPALKHHVPTVLMQGGSWIYGKGDPAACGVAWALTGLLTLVAAVAAIPVMDRKQL